MKTLILLLLLTSAIAAQSGQMCSMASKETPTVRGIKLGMTRAEIQQSSGFDLKSGDRVHIFPAIEIFKSAAFEGIESMEMSFIDNRLTELEVVYDGPVWDDVTEFARSLSKAWNLDPSHWFFNEAKTTGMLRCSAFTANIERFGSRLHLIDTPAIQEAEAKAKSDNDAKKKVFKP